MDLGIMAMNERAIVVHQYSSGLSNFFSAPFYQWPTLAYAATAEHDTPAATVDSEEADDQCSQRTSRTRGEVQ
jgi:hypothetical protein